jgi:hypothetical protein
MPRTDYQANEQTAIFRLRSNRSTGTFAALVVLTWARAGVS